jgi:hypothetical protein
MANTGFLSVSETSFDGIKQNLKTFLKAKSEFKDYDFEGSNLSSLLDILSYNSYLNAFYLNMVGSEMFLDTTQIKTSAVSHAKELNYIPRSRTSARAQVTMTINTGGALPSSIVIPENYVLRTTIDQRNLEFSTNEDIVVFNKNGVYSTGKIYVYEGKIVNEFFNVDTDTKYILQSENVDTNSIKVTVINSATDSTNSVYSYTDSLLGLNSSSEVYFVQGYKDNQYEIVFGDGVSGKKLTNGNIVKVKYRSTNGELGNRVSNFSTTRKIENLYDVTVATNIIATDGSEREDTESIKFYAPRHFTTQNRAVTKEDFVNLIRAKFPQIKTVGVYGGEDAVPPQYGKVIITPIPHGSIPFISSQLKKSIIDYLTTKTITTEPLIYDPEYLYLRVVTNVSYNPSLTTKTLNQLKTEITQKIKDYDSTYLNEFGDDFRKSKLISMIDSTDASIVSNDTTVRMIYKIVPIKTISQRIDFSFSNALYRPLRYEYQLYEQEVVQSSLFSYIKNGVTYTNALITDDGIGNLRICYNVSGVRVVIESNIGSVNYDTGEMSFDINPFDYIGSIDFYAKPNLSDVTVSASKFLRVDYSKTVVIVTPVS